MATFSATILSSLGLDYALKNRLTFFQKIVPPAIYAGIILGLLLARSILTIVQNNIDMLEVTYFSSDIFNSEIKVVQENIFRFFNNSMIALRNTLIPFSVIFISYFLLHVPYRRVLVITIPLLLTISITASADKYLSFTRSDLVFANMPVLEALKNLTRENRFAAEQVELLPANSWSVYGLKAAYGQDALALLSTARYFNLINTNSNKDELLTRYIHLRNSTSPLYNTLNISHFVALDRNEKLSVPDKDGRPFPWIIPASFKEVANIDTIRIYQNTRNLGLAWFPKNIICENELYKTVDLLTVPGYDPADSIVIDCWPDRKIANKDPGYVDVQQVLPLSTRLKVYTPQDNYLIISKSVYPGWKGRIDDHPVQIERANLALMGVYIPKGEHKLELFYESDSFKKGIAISAITLGGWILVFGAAILYKLKKTNLV